MGLMDELRKLTKPYSEDEEYLEEEDMEESSSRPLFQRGNARSYASYAEAPEEAPQERRGFLSGGRTQESRTAPASGGLSAQALKLMVMKPERFEDAADIADHMRQKHSIVLNLETTPKETARRLVDFLSGVAYALDGKIKRIAAGTYIVTPANVDLMGDELEALSSKENYF